MILPIAATLRATPLVALAAATAIAACSEGALKPASLAAAPPSFAPADARRYGPAVQLGNGRARAYTLVDASSGVPIEIGVALDSAAMLGLPEPTQAHGDGHGDMHEYQLQFAGTAPAPYTFVELDWNPAGHGAPYLQPHFDFHFYTISLAERNAIDPKDPEWTAKARRFPAKDFMREGYICPCDVMPVPAEKMAVPRMGLHWIDPRSPEFAGQEFTATFINGTWDGKVLFQEPMVTRAFIMATKDSTFPLPAAKRAQAPGFYPGAYRVSYDATAREYRIALTRLAWAE